jgi:hypothetical protein
MLLDLEGPLFHPMPTIGVSRSGATRSALLQLLAQCGDWIVQLGHLLDTLSLDARSPDEQQREGVVLDHLDRIVAARREAVCPSPARRAIGSR